MVQSPLKIDGRDMPAGMPMQTRLAPVGEVNADTRSVDVVFTTGAAVRRRGWSPLSESYVTYDEILVVSADAIDMTRLNAGAPVLDSHAYWSTRSQLAVVDRAWIEKQEGKASLRFPTAGIDPDIDRFFSLVQDRQRPNISTGYFLQRVRIEKAEKPGGTEKWFVERWQPYEISFVTVGADPGAQVRSEAAKDHQLPVEFVGSPASSGNTLRRMMMRQRQAGLVR